MSEEIAERRMPIADLGITECIANRQSAIGNRKFFEVK